MMTTLSPFLISLKVATISTSIVFILGVLISRILARKEFFGKSILESFFLLPLVLPPTVVGFGLLIIFGKNGFLGQWLFDWFGVQIIFTQTAAIIASIVVSFPLMYQSSTAAFQSVNPRFEIVARTIGASEWRIFWTITFPLAWPGLLSGFILSFARGLGEFGATLMIAGYIPGKTDTIPLAIYFAVEAGEMELATYWVITIIMIGFSTMIWLNWWSKKRINRFR